MYNPGKIITILVLFVLLITAPILLNIGKASEPPAPSLDTAAIEQLDEKQCIESKEFMQRLAATGCKRRGDRVYQQFRSSLGNEPGKQLSAVPFQPQ